MKILLALMQIDEWNQYIPFNAHISEIKKNYDKVIGICGDYPSILLSECDEIITTKDSKSFYPSMLDTPHRKSDDFITTCVSHALKKYSGHEISYTSWQKTPYGESFIKDKSLPFEVYKQSFIKAGEWLNKGGLIYPTEKSFKRIKKKYSSSVDGESYMLLTRNFQNKVPETNTDRLIPELENCIKHLCENGIKINHIGFPKCNFSFEHENYIEIDGNFSQDEFVSLVYLTKGLILPASNGGFVSHFAGNYDCFCLTKQWRENEFDFFKLNEDKNPSCKTVFLWEHLNSVDIPTNVNDFNAILNVFNNHKQSERELIFSEERKIKYL